MESHIDIRCAKCGLMTRGIDTKVKKKTRYICKKDDCGNQLLIVSPNDDSDTVFANILMHDEAVIRSINGANEVHAIEKGDYCGDERAVFMLCYYAVYDFGGQMDSSNKILEHLDYNMKEVGNFFRWYSGISVDKNYKVTNKSKATSKFIFGQIANNIIPGSGSAISVMRFLGSDSAFNGERAYYQDFYKEFSLKIPLIKEYNDSTRERSIYEFEDSEFE